MKLVIGMIALQLLCVVLNLFVALYEFSAFSFISLTVIPLNLRVAYIWFRDREMLRNR